jgi:hypothetical protein
MYLHIAKTEAGAFVFLLTSRHATFEECIQFQIQQHFLKPEFISVITHLLTVNFQEGEKFILPNIVNGSCQIINSKLIVDEESRIGLSMEGVSLIMPD